MRWLLRLYPRRWRRRYGDEFLALIEARGVSPDVIVDVLRGALDAWLHPDLGAAPAPVGAASGATRGGGPFDRFTPRTRVVLELAHTEAQRLQQQQISTEHLLLALLLEGQGVAAHMLIELGVQPAELQAAILQRLQPTGGLEQRPLGLSPDAKRAIELGVAEANRLRHHYFGTEHLLLGLVAEGHGAAADLLRQRHVADLPALRQQLVQLLNAGGPHLRPPR